MYGQELVLRFFAYISACKNNISKGTKYILDNYAKEAVIYSEDEVNELKEFFYNTIEFVFNIFGKMLFVLQKKI